MKDSIMIALNLLCIIMFFVCLFMMMFGNDAWFWCKGVGLSVLLFIGLNVSVSVSVETDLDEFRNKFKGK